MSTTPQPQPIDPATRKVLATIDVPGLDAVIDGNELSMLRVTDNSLVDNTFSAPGVEGCGEGEILGLKFKGFLDSLVNSKLKLPNKAGENTAILNGTLNAAAAETVVESEK